MDVTASKRGFGKELSSDLDKWIKENGSVSNLITKLSLEPRKLNLMELFALAKMAKMPMVEFIDQLITQWPEYVFVDDLVKELPEVLNYVRDETGS
jgi:hypothetical protein